MRLQGRTALFDAAESGRYGSRVMGRERPLDGLMKRLVEAIDVSLQAREAAREAMQEILRRGAETAIFFRGSRRRGLTADLTTQDREFLRALSIKPDR